MTKYSGTLTPKVGNASEPAGEFMRRKDYDELVTALRAIIARYKPKDYAHQIATAALTKAKP